MNNKTKTALADKQPNEKLSDFMAKILVATQNTPNMIWIAVFLFTLILSYILGHLFYRRDPKIPDVKSFQRISKKHKPEELKTGSEVDEWMKNIFPVSLLRIASFRMHISKITCCHADIII